jgi:LacI family transcriptional regulator
MEQVTAYLKAHPETDAIVAASTTAAMASVGALESLGMKVGREIDVLSKEAAPFLQLFRANILSMSEAVDEAGGFLAKAAIRAIREPDLPPMQFLEVPEAP